MIELDISKVKCVVVDWDETVTQYDTIGLLAESAYDFKPDMLPKWSYYEDQYLKDYSRFKKDFGEIDSLERQIEYLNELKPVEKASIDRICKGAVFANVPVNHINEYVGTRLKFRNGWWNFARSLQDNKVRIIVLSVNWCGTMIKHVFDRHGIELSGICSNDLAQNKDNGTCTGEILGDLQTAQDKLRVFSELKKEFINGSGHNGLAYFGDSTTDLSCLLSADYGFLMGKTDVINLLAKLRVKPANLTFASDFTQFKLT